MAYDYAPLTATARRLLAEFGQTVTLTKVTPGAYDPVTGETSDPVTVTEDASAAILPVGGDDVGQTFGDGDMVRQDDRKAIIESTTNAPDELTTLTDAAGVVWDIKVVKAVAPSGEAVIYKAFIRK